MKTRIMILALLLTVIVLHAGSAFAATEGASNTLYGTGAGASSGDDDQCTFIGRNAGNANTSGASNTFIGFESGMGNDTGSYNTFVGWASGYSNTQGADNTFIGWAAGYDHTNGANNTFIGSAAGAHNSTGSGNVFIGFNAGSDETGSNKLYIANSSTNTPLIYGEFDNGKLFINGNLGVSGVVEFNPTSGGVKFPDGTIQTSAVDVVHTHSGMDIINGTVPETVIDPLIARGSEVASAVSAHASRTDNPHSVTATQIGAALVVHDHNLGNYFKWDNSYERYLIGATPGTDSTEFIDIIPPATQYYSRNIQAYISSAETDNEVPTSYGIFNVNKRMGHFYHKEKPNIYGMVNEAIYDGHVTNSTNSINRLVGLWNFTRIGKWGGGISNTSGLQKAETIQEMIGIDTENQIDTANSYDHTINLAAGVRSTPMLVSKVCTYNQGGIPPVGSRKWCAADSECKVPDDKHPNIGPNSQCVMPSPVNINKGVAYYAKTSDNTTGIMTTGAAFWAEPTEHFTNNYGIVLAGNGRGSGTTYGDNQDISVYRDDVEDALKVTGNVHITGNLTVDGSSSGSDPIAMLNGLQVLSSLQGLSNRFICNAFANMVTNEVSCFGVSNEASTPNVENDILDQTIVWTYNHMESTDLSIVTNEHARQFTLGGDNETIYTPDDDKWTLCDNPSSCAANVPVTIFAWVYWDNTTNVHSWLEKFGAAGNRDFNFDTDASKNWNFYLFDNNNVANCYSSYNLASLSSGWHLLVFTFNGTTSGATAFNGDNANMYIDGNEVSSYGAKSCQPDFSYATNGSAPVYIGQKNTTVTAGFTSSVIGLAKDEMSAAEVTNFYNSTKMYYGL